MQFARSAPVGCVDVKALHNEPATTAKRRCDPSPTKPRKSIAAAFASWLCPPQALAMCRSQSSPRLGSRNRPLPSIGETSSGAVRQFKFRLSQETPHVTKFSVRDRTQLDRFSVVNYGTGRQCKRANRANRDLFGVSDLDAKRSVIDPHVDELQRHEL